MFPLTFLSIMVVIYYYTNNIIQQLMYQRNNEQLEGNKNASLFLSYKISCINKVETKMKGK